MAEDRRASSRERPYAVAELIRHAGRQLDQLGLAWIEGEVSQATLHSSGHIYFSLRDATTVLPAVMWGRDVARIKFKIEAGRRVRVRGRLNIYDRDGKMQLYVDYAEPAGAGAEAAALEALKAKLAAEGMFAATKKRPLPKFPRRIGIVTSARGAAVHDIIRTVQRRLPTPILIADAAVQGPSAPAQLVSAMAMLVRAGVDVLIVGRGGGAATDLTAFNHERVVRTISRCPVPVISAVGHETDLSLADLAADARASTPTAAAELAVADGQAIADVIEKESRRLSREMHHRLDRARQDLDRVTMALHARGERALAATRHQLAAIQQRLVGLHPRARLLANRSALSDLERRLAAAHPRVRLLAHRSALAALESRLAKAAPSDRIARAQRQLAELAQRRDTAMQRRLDRGRSNLAEVGAAIAALSPLAVLDRGYAMVRHGTAIVRDASTVARGDRLSVRLAKGQLEVVVDDKQEPPA